MPTNIIDSIQLSGVTYTLQGSGGGTVSSAITSGDTNAVAGGAVYDKFDEVEQVTARALNDLDEKINPTVELTQAQYDALVSAGTVSANTYYIITDATPIETSGFVQTSAITSSVTSASTDSQIPTAKAVWEAASGGGTTYTAGRGIDITNDTISVSLSISAGTGNNSIAEGFRTKANGENSHAEGRGTIAGDYAHAEGYSTEASGENSHAEGDSTTASGYSSHAEGAGTEANGFYSHAEGVSTIANNQSEHASGKFNVSNTGSTDADKTLFSVGNGTSNNARHNAFEIRQNGDIYLSSGGTDIKLQDYLGGGGTTYTAGRGIDITSDTISVSLPISAGTGSYSIQEGQNTQASGNYSHAEGEYTEAYGRDSHAEGGGTQANGLVSHAEGIYTKANNRAEHASGQYNVSNKASDTFGDSGNTLFSVGNGTANDARHNAFEIRQNGDIYLTSGGTDIKLQDHLGGTASSAITSGDTNAVAGGAVYDKIDEIEQVTAAGLNALNDNFGGLKLVKLTQAEYNALATKDSSTLYIIVN